MSPQRILNISIAAALTVASVILMLSCASPELIWDEADYVGNAANSWKFLWSRFDYTSVAHAGFSAWGRHNHGPMAIFLAKLGQQALPGSWGSPVLRLRFLEAAIGSLAVGLLYFLLRRCFNASRAAALVGAGLLLLSVIRLKETNIIGPHDLMLLCTLSLVSLGYLWREKPTFRTAAALGAVIAFGYLSMEYVIPAVVCWLVAITVAGKNWISWDRANFKVSWAFPAIAVTAAIIVLLVWPPGVLQHAVLNDFRVYLHYSNFPTLVGDRIFEVTPRTAALYWLSHLDAPILIVSVAVISIGLFRAFRTNKLSSKHLYLGVFLGFFLFTALAAHMAGARNLLQFVGLLCVATGALFDDAVGDKPRLGAVASTAIVVLAAVNLVWVSHRYTPNFATDGYQAFLRENQGVLQERGVKALVYGMPELRFYADQDRETMNWNADEILWTTRADLPIAPDVKYVLIPSLVYEHMPENQPLRSVVADHWKVVWSFKANHIWELRLFERPAPVPD